MCVLDPNDVLRALETGGLGAVFAFRADLRYPMAVAHLPFMCRQTETPLVEMKAGAAPELTVLLQPNRPAKDCKNYLFMFALRKGKHAEVDRFCQQFSKQPPIDPTQLPAVKIIEKRR